MLPVGNRELAETSNKGAAKKKKEETTVGKRIAPPAAKKGESVGQQNRGRESTRKV